LRDGKKTHTSAKENFTEERTKTTVKAQLTVLPMDKTLWTIAKEWIERPGLLCR
jgi:hypothetical protein